MQALVDSAIEYAEEIRRSGHYIASDALQRAQTARTIRVRAGKVSTTAGPFVETKEQLGGFFVIEAKDMDEACAVAAKFPPARVAVIEIRPVQELTHSRDRRGLRAELEDRSHGTSQGGETRRVIALSVAHHDGLSAPRRPRDENAPARARYGQR